MRPTLGMFSAALITVSLLGCGGGDNKTTSSSASSTLNSAAVSSAVTAMSSEPSSVTASSMAPSTSAPSSTVSSLVASSALAVSSSALSSMAASSNAPATASVAGVAAIGDPIVNGTVTAKCANGTGFTQTVTTNSQGAFSGTLAISAFPCALQITGGTPAVTLHSYALSAGTVNITPLTDLVIASAAAQTPSTWFLSSSWQITDTQLQATINNVRTALTTAGYVLPEGAFAPFTVGFQIGDVWDQLLDQLQAAITASSTLSSYADLLNLIKDGNLNAIPVKNNGNTGGGLTGNAGSCFNADLVKQGAQIQLNYKSTDGASGAVINTAAAIEVKGSVAFNGVSAIETVSQTQATGATPSTSVTKTYVTVDAASKRFRYSGSVVDVSAPVAVSTTVTINPSRLERFDLNAGESYSQNYSTTTATQVLGFPVNTVAQIASTVTFKGIETITVPAGSFSACRIETQNQTTTAGSTSNSTSTSWFSVETGISIRTESAGDISELVSATINGKSI